MINKEILKRALPYVVPGIVKDITEYCSVKLIGDNRVICLGNHQLWLTIYDKLDDSGVYVMKDAECNDFYILGAVPVIDIPGKYDVVTAMESFETMEEMDNFIESKITLRLSTKKDDPFMLNLVKHTVVKNPIKVRAKQVTEKTKILAMEGNLYANPGDYIVVGKFGEVYPSVKENFEKKYDLIETTSSDVDKVYGTYKYEHERDEDSIVFSKEEILQWNVYEVKYIELKAFQTNTPIYIDSDVGPQYGKKGDWVIVVKPDYYYICNKEVFEETYKVID